MTQSPPPPPAKDADKRARSQKIGSQLRSLYDEIAREPIPQDFIELLESADALNDDDAGDDDE